MATSGLSAIDPYAAPIVSAANMIMQGAQGITKSKQEKADRAWQEELRERKRKDWEDQDAVNKAVTQYAQELYQSMTPTEPVRELRQSLPQYEPAPAQPPTGAAGLQRQQPNLPQYEPAPAQPPTGGGGGGGRQALEDPEKALLSAWEKMPAPGDLLSHPAAQGLDPKQKIEFTNNVIDLQTDTMRRQQAFLGLQAQEANRAREMLTHKLQQAAVLAESGDPRAASDILVDAYNEYLPDSKTAEIGEKGKVRLKNFITNEEGVLDLNGEDKESVKKAIGSMYSLVRAPEEFMKQWFLNSEIQKEKKKQALKEAEPFMDKSGNVLWRAEIPNSKTKGWDTLWFDHKPHWKSDPIPVSKENEKNLTSIDTVKAVSTLQGKQPKGALTEKDKAKYRDKAIQAYMDAYSFNPEGAPPIEAFVEDYMNIVISGRKTQGGRPGGAEAQIKQLYTKLRDQGLSAEEAYVKAYNQVVGSTKRGGPSKEQEDRGLSAKKEPKAKVTKPMPERPEETPPAYEPPPEPSRFEQYYPAEGRGWRGLKNIAGSIDEKVQGLVDRLRQTGFAKGESGNLIDMAKRLKDQVGDDAAKDAIKQSMREHGATEAEIRAFLSRF